MTTPTYPVFFELLQGPAKWGYDAPYSERGLARVTHALQIIADATIAERIANPVMKDAADVLNRALDVAWSRSPRPSHDERANQPWSEAFDSYPSLSLSSWNTRRKRLLAAPDHPLKAQLLALVDEVAPFVGQVATLKAKGQVHKRQTKTEAQRAEEAANRFVVPPSNVQAVQRVRALLETVIEGRYQEILDDLKARNRALLTSFVAKAAEAIVDPTLNGKDRHGRRNPHYTPAHHAGNAMLIYPIAVYVLQKMTQPQERAGSYSGWDFVARPDAQAIGDAEAVTLANEIRDRFIFKNLTKIAAILERKGDAQFKSATILGNELNLYNLVGRFGFAFHDGSSFEITTTNVFVVNDHGTRFWRNPLTFHNVKLPGGIKMPSPSESRMYEVFAPEAASVTPPAAPTVRSRRRP